MDERHGSVGGLGSADGRNEQTQVRCQEAYEPYRENISRSAIEQALHLIHHPPHGAHAYQEMALVSIDTVGARSGWATLRAETAMTLPCLRKHAIVSSA
ncbi:MAG: hypothetical protein AAB263_04825 [Planctomycetota bacterium]